MALRLPDGELIPVWDGVHGRELNLRRYDGWGEVVIELIKLRGEGVQ